MGVAWYFGCMRGRFDGPVVEVVVDGVEVAGGSVSPRASLKDEGGGGKGVNQVVIEA